MTIQVATIICHRNLPELVDRQVEQIRQMTMPNMTNKIMVISAGSDLERESKYKTFWYPDNPFRGKCYAHNVGLKVAGLDYDYYWFNHPDLNFEVDMSCLQKLIKCMERNPEIVVLSPIHSTNYLGKNIKTVKGWHKVATTDYLSLLIRKNCVERFGFLSKIFEYCWGAIVEYSYWIYSQSDWCIAYCENAQVIHLGGTTYGKAYDRIDRSDYIRHARNFALRYYRENYGEDWTKKFFNVLPEEIKRLRYSGRNEPTTRPKKYCEQCDKECVEGEWGRIVCKRCKKRLSPQEYYERHWQEHNPYAIKRKVWQTIT